MKPRLFPLILIVGMGMAASVFIYSGIREHTLPPVVSQEEAARQNGPELANEERSGEAEASGQRD